MRSEFDGRDVVRVRWRWQGFRVEVSQTLSLLTIKLTPEDESGTGLDPVQRLLQARSIAARIFPVSSERRTDQGEIAPVEDLNEEIVARSFSRETAKGLEDDGVVVGGPVVPYPEGMLDDQGRVAQDTPPAPVDWLRIILSASHWSGTVCWWNDGQSIGIYLNKLAGGSSIPDFGEPRDRNWFRSTPKAGSRFSFLLGDDPGAVVVVDTARGDQFGSAIWDLAGWDRSVCLPSQRSGAEGVGRDVRRHQRWLVGQTPVVGTSDASPSEPSLLMCLRSRGHSVLQLRASTIRPPNPQSAIV
jgi:hypothetical protein